MCRLSRSPAPTLEAFQRSKVRPAYERATPTAGAFERGSIEFNGLFPAEIMTYESNIAYELRFMIDTKARTDS